MEIQLELLTLTVRLKNFNYGKKDKVGINRKAI